MTKRISYLIILAVGVFVAYSFTFTTDFTDAGDPWPVPEKYEKMKNPVASNKESLSVGKSLYNLHCKSCHGKEGMGDGPKAAQLDTPSGDFTGEDFQAQSDGALFYKTLEGRDDMPGYKKKIPDAEDMWSVVNYLRTLE